jgi:hypothetical protein
LKKRLSFNEVDEEYGSRTKLMITKYNQHEACGGGSDLDDIDDINEESTKRGISNQLLQYSPKFNLYKTPFAENA